MIATSGLTAVSWLAGLALLPFSGLPTHSNLGNGLERKGKCKTLPTICWCGATRRRRGQLPEISGRVRPSGRIIRPPAIFGWRYWYPEPIRLRSRGNPQAWLGRLNGMNPRWPAAYQSFQQVPERRVLAHQRHRIALTGIHKFCGGLGRGLPAPVALTSNRDNYPANWTRTSWPDARRQVYRISDKASSFPAMGKGGVCLKLALGSRM
jgi:hypothetical protein